MLLRLPQWLLEIRNKKQWTFDWMKHVSIGIPAQIIKEKET